MTAPEKISALWFLPTFGDGRYLGSPDSARAGDFGYTPFTPRCGIWRG